MSDDRETTGQCGWVALGLVFILLSGLLPGSLFGGMAGLKIAEFFGLDHAYEFGQRIFILAGMIIGLLTATLIVMSATFAFLKLVARLRQLQFPLREHSLRRD